MRTLRLLGLLAVLCQQLAPQLARAQAAPAPRAPAPTTESAPPAPPPVAPAAPPGAFPQGAEAAPPPSAAPAPPPPIASGYPYGYGYGYPPGPVDPAHAKTLGELQGVDLRLADLHRQQKRYSLGGPIAMMSAGYGVAIGFGIGAIVTRVIAEDIEDGECGYNNNSYYYEERCDLNDDGDIDSHDEHDARVLSRTFGAVSAIAGGVGILGTVFMIKRMAKRREFDPEIDQLTSRRSQLLQQLRYGGGVSQNGLQLTLSGRF